MNIVVLGGGITGLSSAFHLSRRFPDARITLIEKADRLGGWIKSERVNAASSSVVLETGPRTLRPVDKATLELVSSPPLHKKTEPTRALQIHLLDLTPQLITAPKTSPAAKSRFLYVPDLGGLLPLPSSLTSLLLPWSDSRPLSWILLHAVLTEPFWSANRPAGTQGAEGDDESVDAFLARRFGEDFARVFGSALVHGIYAADSRTLSVRAAFPSLWDAEAKGNGSVLWGMMRGGGGKKDENVYELGDMLDRMKGVSVLSFKDGIEALPRALEAYLAAKHNVKILKRTSVSGLAMTDEEHIEVHCDDLKITATHVVSTLPLPVLRDILPPSQQLPHLTANPFTTVTVVNLVFPVHPDQVHPPGFGYLVPRPRDPIADALPIIGTVFDSCSLSAQDDPPIHTKITVMIKGEHPLPSTPSAPASPSDIPDMIINILSALSTHLSTSLPDPVLWRVHVNRQCIPTYTVGHRRRMEELENRTKEVWKGRLELAGSGLGGVSVADCIRAGRKVFA